MARLLERLAGNQDEAQPLITKIAQKKLPSLLLFVGRDGDFKTKFALAIGQALVCQSDSKPCGTCGPCLRWEKQQSEALLLIRPEKLQIKVEQAQQIHHFLHLEVLGNARVIVIEDAHLLNQTSANSLLKCLEEPPPDTYFFLTAPSPRHVMTTVRSRAVIRQLRSLTESEIKASLGDREVPAWMIKMARGSLDKLKLVQDSQYQEQKKLLGEWLQQWIKNPSQFLLSNWRENIKDRSQALQMSSLLINVLRDSLIHGSNRENFWVNEDLLPVLQQLQSLPGESLCQMAEQACQVESALLHQRDPTMVFEEFWLRSAQNCVRI